MVVIRKRKAMAKFLKQNDYKVFYSKESANNVLNDFLIPSFKSSIKYDRMCGFFSSSVFEVYFEGLKDFIERNGKIRILCSYKLSREDVIAIHEGKEERLNSILIKELDEILKGKEKVDKLKILSGLISSGSLEIKIGLIEKEIYQYVNQPILHEKIGIFYDDNDDFISFQGSLNESKTAVMEGGNSEVVSPHLSWDNGRDGDLCHSWKDYFEKAWNNKNEIIKIVDIPSEFSDIFIKKFSDDNWLEILDEYNKKPKLEPRKHQETARENWLKVGRGILQHATGSGKTITAILIMKKLIDDGLSSFFLIMVPQKLLLYQWQEEIQKWMPEVSILLCGDNNNNWRRQKFLKRYFKNDGKPRVAIAIKDTSIKDEFVTQIQSIHERFTIVADEVHELGTNESKTFLKSVNPKYRLGLSATPIRHNDDVGTSQIFSFFGDILDPVYLLKDAIRDGHLTRYYYYTHLCDLTLAEQEEWDQLSKEISRLTAIKKSSNSSKSINDQLKRKTFKRASIIKTAESKYKKAIDIIKNNFDTSANQKWLIYCSTIDQIIKLRKLLEKEGYNFLEYHSDLSPKKQKDAMEFFKKNDTVLISADMLDQGIDIPAVSHAVIISSTQNPRKYIQRRGRVLRKSKFKTFSYIHDLFVLPKNRSDKDVESSITTAEIRRGYDFAEDAENSYVRKDIKIMLIDRGISFRS
jgi:superfamily II DNA or RNA helicase